nr:hypothetical protein Iba_chr02cCG1360 [Ipomoea batatas]
MVNNSHQNSQTIIAQKKKMSAGILSKKVVAEIKERLSFPGNWEYRDTIKQSCCRDSNAKVVMSRNPGVQGYYQTKLLQRFKCKDCHVQETGSTSILSNKVVAEI